MYKLSAISFRWMGLHNWRVDETQLTVSYLLQYALNAPNVPTVYIPAQPKISMALLGTNVQSMIDTHNSSDNIDL